MGCTPSTQNNSQKDPGHGYQLSSRKIQEPDYDLDVIEMYNLALAMKHRQPTLSIQISLSCDSLRKLDIFGSVNPMIVCFKTEVDIPTNNHVYVEIGRTQIIPHEPNPKFIKTFIISYNEEKTEGIEFHVYDIDKNRSELNKQPLVGIVETNMREIVEAGTLVRDIGEKSYHKPKGQLKICSSEYDGGNTKFEIQLNANNFVNRHQLFLKLEVFKSTEWIPIYRTQSFSNHKQTKFPPFEIPTNKFPEEDRGRFRIKVFESSESKTEVCIGSTEEIYIQDMQHNIKVFKDAFIIGHITINKFQKVIRDSFISYIINGTHLHLLVAVDFSSSTEPQHTTGKEQEKGGNGSGVRIEGKDRNDSKEKVVDGNQEDEIEEVPERSQSSESSYVKAIGEVVGVLQSFDYYNQIPMYGFGAKLPPYYKTVSQCFALSGNFFQPIIGGGVDQLLKIYTKALKKIKCHGPSKLMEIIKLACEYAQADPQSTDYYILVVFTDGNIDDQEEVRRQITQASGYALSILFVGLGQVNSKYLESLTKINDKEQKDGEGERKREREKEREREKDPHREEQKRDIVQFLNYNAFATDNNKKIIKQIFSRIPKQYLEYMKARKIRPSTNKKDLLSTTLKESKIAKAEYINFKINENKKLQLDRGRYVVYKPNFLNFKKRHLTKILQESGFQSSPLLEQMNICMNDINYFIEMESYHKHTPALPSDRQTSSVTYIKETHKLDQLTENKRRQIQKRTLLKLEASQNNQYGARYKKKETVEVAREEVLVPTINTCVHCKKYEIDLFYQACGHACCCHRCEAMYCQICRQRNTGAVFMQLDNLQ